MYTRYAIWDITMAVMGTFPTDRAMCDNIRQRKAVRVLVTRVVI